MLTFSYHQTRTISKYVSCLLILASLLLFGCASAPQPMPSPTPTEPVLGCDGQAYPNPATSLYVLPYAIGESFQTGLTNCSSSFHRAGTPDQYAYDFDMPVGTPFTAARAGTVYAVVEDAPSKGGGAGNYVSIDHGDDTYGLYLHSPEDGISVSVGDKVEQGDVLGETGRSGLAGYPHLHFIVVKGDPSWPYEGIPVSFSNAIPADVTLEGNTVYEAGPY